MINVFTWPMRQSRWPNDFSSELTSRSLCDTETKSSHQLDYQSMWFTDSHCWPPCASATLFSSEDTMHEAGFRRQAITRLQAQQATEGSSVPRHSLQGAPAFLPEQFWQEGCSTNSAAPPPAWEPVQQTADQAEHLGLVHKTSEPETSYDCRNTTGIQSTALGAALHPSSKPSGSCWQRCWAEGTGQGVVQVTGGELRGGGSSGASATW